MNADITINDQLFQQLKTKGEIQARESHGVEIVVMTIDARRKLSPKSYDDSPWTADEQMSILAARLQDPMGWGEPKMDSYDDQYGHLFDDDAEI